jgi:hypothetical protein
MIFFRYGIRKAGFVNIYTQVDIRVDYDFLYRKLLKKSRVFKFFLFLIKHNSD